MILIALCFALLLGLIVVGGRVSNLASVNVKWGWLAPLAFLMQAYLIFFPGNRAGGLLSARSLLLTASHVLLLVVIWRNRHLGGVKLLGLGLLLNFLVMVMNGGFMPITPETLVQIGYDGNVARLETGFIVGRTKNVVNSLRLARERGAKTMCITDFRHSPITKHADICLCAVHAENSLGVEMVATRAAHLALMDAIATCVALRNRERAIKSIKLNERLLVNLRY